MWQSHLEEAVSGGPLQLGVDVGQVVEGGVPGQVLHLLVQVLQNGQGRVVPQHAGPGQVQGVVNQLPQRGGRGQRGSVGQELDGT